MVACWSRLERPCVWEAWVVAAGKGSLPRVTQVILLQVQRCAKLPGLPGDPCCSRGGGPQVPLPGASHSPSFLSWGPRCMEGGLDPAHQAWLSGGPVWPHFAPSGMGEKRPTIVVQLSSPTCVFPRAAPQGATPAPRRPLSWPGPLRASLASRAVSGETPSGSAHANSEPSGLGLPRWAGSGPSQPQGGCCAASPEPTLCQVTCSAPHLAPAQASSPSPP